VLPPSSGLLLTLTGLHPLCPLPWITTTSLATRLHNPISQPAPSNPEDGDSIFLRNLDIRLQDLWGVTTQKSIFCKGYGTWFGCEVGLAAQVRIYRATFGGQGLLEVMSVVPGSALGARLFIISHDQAIFWFRLFRRAVFPFRTKHAAPAALLSLVLICMWLSQSVTSLLAGPPESRGSIPGGQKSFSSPQHTYLFWGILSLLSCGYLVSFHGVNQPWREAAHLPPSNDGVKNVFLPHASSWHGD
jgi:hypothetical protein